MFADGTNWSGTSGPVSNPTLRRWLEDFGPREISEMGDAVVVAVGATGAFALTQLARADIVREDRLLVGMPHPSGANVERVTCYLGRKAVA